VQCTTSADCAPGLVCETKTANGLCVQCTTNSDCPAGEACNSSGSFDTYPLDFWVGTDTCEPDCRGNADICKPGACEGDSGICLSNTSVVVSSSDRPCVAVLQTGWCTSNADCQVNGAGACNFSTNIDPFSPSNGYSYCVPCTVDGGGCIDPSVFCQQWSCPQDGVAGDCVFNCFADAGACRVGTFCSDAGPMGVDGGIVGSCAPGCDNSSNCPADAPICSDGVCVRCVVAADCPDYAAGCQNNQCGNCTTSSDCPGSEFCGSGGCGQRCHCYSDSDCPLDVPTCVGGDAGSQTAGACACTDQSQCPSGDVCETRGPYTIVNDLLWCGPSVGGVCIPACVSNADCAKFPGAGNGVCNTTTGFCVPCMTDTDCTGGTDPSKPTITPSCIFFPDGGNFYSSLTLDIGGGWCGCSDHSQCNGGYTCLDSSCSPACSYVNGVDSCTQNASDQCPDSNYPGGFCNTFTGGCQHCLDDYDCTSRDCNRPSCQNGYCVSCLSGDDCPMFPNNSCLIDCTSACEANENCPTDGGYVCVSGVQVCLVDCVIGDDAGLGTVSDAGNPCPANAPFCLTGLATNLPAGMGYCSQCQNDQQYNNDQTFCDAGYHCPHDGGASCNTPVCSTYCD
jgi:Cys-rich repeat protein